MTLMLLFTINILPYKDLHDCVKEVKKSSATEGERGDRNSIHGMMAFSRASLRKKISQK
jgi:hypothetical protein